MQADGFAGGKLLTLGSGLRGAVVASGLAGLTACSAAFGAPAPADPTPTVQVVSAMYKIPPPPSATPAAPVVPKRRLRQLTVTGSGDILIHPALWGQAKADATATGPNFEPMLAPVRARLAHADYSICHVEAQFSDPTQPETVYPRYFVHPNLAKAIAYAGFDECSMASNWTFDKGLAGIDRTNRALERVGVRHSGSAATKARAERVVIHTVNGIRLAHISYTAPSESPGIEGADWAVNRQTPTQIAADAKAARAAGAEIVIVSLAMGDMGSTQTNSGQESAIRTITAGGNVDYVIGHGSHTVQPAEKVNGTWVVWHGNLLTAFFPEQVRLHEGLISSVHFSEQPNGRFAAAVTAYPVLSVPDPYRELDLAAASCSGGVPARWRAAYEATAAIEAAAIKGGLQLVRPCSGAR